MSSELAVFNKFPIIELDDLVLRQISYDDIQDYYDYLSDEEVIRYVPEECIPRNIDRAKEEIDYTLDLFRYKRSVYWAIAQQKDNKLIGSIGFNYWNRDHARAEISYDLAKRFWGKGVMTKAVKAVLGFGYVQMNLHRIEATVTPTNHGSLRVLQKLNFKKEGVLREQKLLHGKFHDAIILSLLKQEYFPF